MPDQPETDSPQREPQLEASWLAVLRDEFSKPYMADLRAFLVEEKQQHPVYPPGGEIFNAFELTPFEQVRVVILGQDPYHGPGQANGLCFSVRRGVKPPPSLRNIFKELHTDLDLPMPSHGDLTHWGGQGVLLLNTVLTVRHRTAFSHRKHGWETFTDQVIRAIASQRENVVFLLWGSAAGKKAKMIDSDRHRIIRSPHPSPLSASRGFFGSRPFSQINDYLASLEQPAIDWALPS